MSIVLHQKNLLGINGAGRIGKLTLWHHLLSRKFDGIVLNVGREVGKSLEDLVQALTTDSTYGSLSLFLYYIQSALMLPDAEKTRQELRPLLGVRDMFRKVLITETTARPWFDENGILRLGIYDFLLDDKLLDL